MTESLPCQLVTGSSVQPSGRDAVLRSIQSEVGCSPETVMALCALSMGLMRQTLCGDAFVLACYSGEDIALQNGVSEEEWQRVVGVLASYWKRQRSKNPLSGMF